MLIRIPVHKIPVSSRYFGRPKGVYHNMGDFLASARSQTAGDKCIRVYPAEILQRSLPRILGVQMKEACSASLRSECPEACVYLIHDVRFWGHYGGTLITSDDRLLNDFSRDVWGIQRHKIFTKLKLPRCRPLSGVTAVLTTPEARHNYWHWTFELLPRIHLLRQAGVSLENVDHFLINHGDHAYQRETLEKLKIPWKKVVQCNGRVHLLLEKAWIASPLDSDDNGIPAWVAGFVAGMSETKLPAGEYPRKIYVSRKDTALRRNIINEQEILPILKEHGFKTVDPGTMSMAEQQRTFASAEAVFGVNGAGLTNIAYCSRGAKVYVVYPYDHQRFCFWFLSSVKGLKYNCMLAEKNPAQRTGVRADMAIDADKLRELLSV